MKAIDTFAGSAIENDRLRAVNAELVAALDMLIGAYAIPSTACNERPAYDKARAALANNKKDAA